MDYGLRVSWETVASGNQLQRNTPILLDGSFRFHWYEAINNLPDVDNKRAGGFGVFGSEPSTMYD